MLPSLIQADYDLLSPAQKNAFDQMVAMSNAGQPGQLLMSDMAYIKILEMVKRMTEEPNLPIEPDRSVNHDWEFDPKANKGK